MKRILFVVTRSDDIGGVQKHVRDLALWCKKNNYQVIVLFGGNGQFGDLLKHSKIEFLKCSSLKREINIYYDFKAIFEIKNIIKKLKPNLIHIHSPKARIIFSILKFLGLKKIIISTVHGWPFNSFSRFNQLYKILELIAAHTLDQTITDGHREKDFYLYNKFPKNKLITIHNGVSDIEPKSNYQLESNDPLRLIMIGRFEKQKDDENLINALALLKEFNWNMKFLGKGPLENNIKNKVKELSLTKRISFLGWQENVGDFLNNSDLFLLISNWEGFPVSIVEAMRSGLPIIASDVGGVSESVNHGINGYLVPKNDPKSLVKFLKIILKNKKLLSEFGKSSRKIYLEKFNSEIMFNKIEKIYLKFINKN